MISAGGALPGLQGQAGLLPQDQAFVLDLGPIKGPKNPGAPETQGPVEWVRTLNVSPGAHALQRENGPPWVPKVKCLLGQVSAVAKYHLMQ